jgi:hypothetical protein
MPWDPYCQPPDGNPPHKTHRRAQCNRLEDVQSSADPTVEYERDLPPRNGTAFPQGIYRGHLSVQLATAVIRDNHSVYTVVDCELDVLSADDWTCYSASPYPNGVTTYSL